MIEFNTAYMVQLALNMQYRAEQTGWNVEGHSKSGPTLRRVALPGASDDEIRMLIDPTSFVSYLAVGMKPGRVAVVIDLVSTSLKGTLVLTITTEEP